MDVYSSEEQQVEAIKSWWKSNGKAVVIGVIIGLGALVAWRYYEDHTQTQKIEASDSYSQVITGLESGQANAIAETQAFINNNSDSQYSVLAALQLAKTQVEKGDFDAAVAQLQWITKHTTDDTLLPLAQTRLARILAQQDHYDQALTTLSQVSAQGWQGQVDELRGDVLVEQGNVAKAREAYIKAQQLGGSPTLQLKLDNLAQAK